MSGPAADTLGPEVSAGANPFSARTALMLVLFGCLVFVALLWMIGNGMAEGAANNGGGHAEGRGLNGYAGMVKLLERRDYTVRRSRNREAFKRPGLLVLTPNYEAKAEDIQAAITAHRAMGPTMLVLPKWNAVPLPSQLVAESEAQPGWVVLAGARPPEWAEQLDVPGPLDVSSDAVEGANWSGLGRTGKLPDRAAVQSLSSGVIAAVVRDQSGQTLAGYYDDETAPYTLSGVEPDPDATVYPLVVVAEPDLLDNYGMADRQRGLLGLALITGLADEAYDFEGEQAPIVFDMTLAGLERDDNLLTLAFSPPFLAATLCLLLAAAVIGWRAFLRFGPPRAPVRAIAFGKRALVANSAGLIIRSRRLHLLGGPYADAARQRLVRAFALTRSVDPASELTAIDRAARGRGAEATAFSQGTARLTNARKERDLVKAAQDLHALERTLTR